MLPNFAETSFRFPAGSLLHPIADSSPAGESLRYEGTYDKIREARTEDDPVLAQGVWKAPLKKAQWSDVADLCLVALENRSKDIQVAAWLTEAWLHLHGFAGLREGLRVMIALCDQYWDDLYPRSEAEDDLEYRLAAIEWINEKLPPVIRLLPLTDPDSADVSAYSWNDWESATRNSSRDEAGGASQSQFQQSAMMTRTSLYVGLREVLESTAGARQELEDLLRRRCGDQAASLRQLANVLDQIRGFVMSTLTQRKDANQEASARYTPPASIVEVIREDRPPAVEPMAGYGLIRDRSEAYQRLSEAAAYLARTEPHSPTPYLVRRAIAWGSLRLEDLLPELVQNSSELGEIFRLLQIHKSSS